MKGSQSLSVPPPREGFFSGTLRRIRWSVGWIKIGDLTSQSDSDLMSIAEDWIRRSKPRRAAIVLGAFSQRTTMDPRILQRYGDVSRGLGSHDAAVFSYLQAAELHLQAGIVQKACALLQQLVRFYPDHIDARLSLGRVLESLERRKEAAANYAIVAKIFEAHGQFDASQPLLLKIAELWPQARADYRPSRGNSLAPSQVVVGQPATLPSPTQKTEPEGAIELDLDSLISSFALEAQGAPQEPTVPVKTLDPKPASPKSMGPKPASPKSTSPKPIIDVRAPSTVRDPWEARARSAPPERDGPSTIRDPWEQDRPSISVPPGEDAPTSSYEALDGSQDGGQTLMDFQSIDSTLVGNDSPSFASPDATILDLRAVVDPRSPAGGSGGGASRMIDRSEDDDDATNPDKTAKQSPTSPLAKGPLTPAPVPKLRKLTSLKRVSHRPS